MVSRILRTYIMGPPGSGKGTISERIVKDFGVCHLSSGDLLRSHIAKKTEIGITAQQYIEKGELVPDKVMVNLMAEEVRRLSGKSWLLDGFPRTLAQAKALQEKETIDQVINLNVPFEVIIDRIKGRWVHQPSGRVYHTEFNPPKKPGVDDLTGETLMQRDDDKPDTVLARLTHYQELTQPLIDFYRNQGILQEFTGKYSNEIWPHVHAFLSSKMKPLQYTEYK